MNKTRILLGTLPFLCAVTLLSCNSPTPSTPTAALTAPPASYTTQDEPDVHVHVFGEWMTTQEATCTTQGTQERSCTCGEIETATIDALGHTETISEPALLTSCTKWSVTAQIECSLCKTVLQEKEMVAPREHHYANQICTVCNYKEPDFTDIHQYASNEGYTFFETAPNGAAMQMLYDEMEQVLTQFHTDSTIDAPYYLYNSELGNLYTAATFNYVQYGLGLDEAQTVYTIFRKDHPVFYWMSYWLYWQNGSIVITTVEEYASGENRSQSNQLVYDGIAEYVRLAEGETSAYTIALIYYDAILQNNTYAYTASGGVESAQWAHSIIGDFLYGKFVCEGYAKLFQLLLNVSGVENRFITGDANGSHLWNLIRLEDGNWYWFDPTWGDEKANPYQYFCVLDQSMTTHTPTPSNRYGMYFNMTLPDRAKTPFQSDAILEIGEAFTMDDHTYTLIAAHTVKSTDGFKPATQRLLYKGTLYTIAD